jgi:hypothetical protein
MREREKNIKGRQKIHQSGAFIYFKFQDSNEVTPPGISNPRETAAPCKVTRMSSKIYFATLTPENLPITSQNKHPFDKFCDVVTK